MLQLRVGECDNTITFNYKVTYTIRLPLTIRLPGSQVFAYNMPLELQLEGTLAAAHRHHRQTVCARPSSLPSGEVSPRWLVNNVIRAGKWPAWFHQLK